MNDIQKQIATMIYSITNNKHFTETVVMSLATDGEQEKMYDFLLENKKCSLSEINRKTLEITAKRLNINI